MLKKIKEEKYKILIFIVEAICMIIELVASRILSPYFGNSNVVWTSVIGIILLSSSIGNFMGGKIADKNDLNKSLKAILFMAAIFTLFIPIFQKIILICISNTFTNIKIGAIISTLILFFIPSLFLGFLNPIIIKLSLKDIDSAGTVSGKVYAIATIGGIFGTFLGGFVLVPNFGSVQILYVITIILLLLTFMIDIKNTYKKSLVIVIIIIISITLFTYTTYANNSKEDRILSGEDLISISYDTQYGRVIIKNGYIKNEHVRILNIDSGYESSTFIDEGKENDLVFEYTKYYNLMFKSKNDINNVMLIGGAGYSYPKYFISHYLDKNLDVVEIDGDITKIARKFFYLDKLINDYNLNENKRLNLINEDGRTYLNRNTKKYDAILNDAFSGNTPAKTLTTLELIKKIKASLNQDGLYLTNIISSLEGNDSKFLRAEVNTLKQVFKNVYVIPCNTQNDTEKTQNNMVIATDQDIFFENAYNLKLDENEIILTDNYCPVDSLIPKK